MSRSCGHLEEGKRCVCVCVCVCVLAFSMFVCLSVCLSVYLTQPVCLSVCLSVYLTQPVCLSICLSDSACLSVYLSVCLSVYLSVYLSVHLCLSCAQELCLCSCGLLAQLKQEGLQTQVYPPISLPSPPLTPPPRIRDFSLGGRGDTETRALKEFQRLVKIVGYYSCAVAKILRTITVKSLSL